MTDVARLIAVADLLVDEGRLLDRTAIAGAAAEHAARLTRASWARVVLTTADGVVQGSYPGAAPFGDPVLEAPVEAGATVGSVGVGAPVDGRFSHLDAWLVDVVARRVESRLATVELHEAELAAKDVVRDAELAGELQRALISAERRTTPRVDGAGRLLPARRVGGDLFDLIEVDGGLLAVLADVSGKGAPASLLTSAVLSTVHHHAALVGARPGRLLAAVARAMEPMLERTGRLVTLAIAGVDWRGGEARVASAGHHPVFVCSEGRSEVIRPTAPPLGVVLPGDDEALVDFSAGTAVLLASDGIADQSNLLGEPFGMARIAEVLEGILDPTPDLLVQHLLDAVGHHAGSAPQDDDQAVAALVSHGGIA